jgi:hypothetical protein
MIEMTIEPAQPSLFEKNKNIVAGSRTPSCRCGTSAPKAGIGARETAGADAHEQT